MANEKRITLLRAHEIVAAFHRQCSEREATDLRRAEHAGTADDLDEWVLVHGTNPAWHVPLTGERRADALAAGERGDEITVRMSRAHVAQIAHLAALELGPGGEDHAGLAALEAALLATRTAPAMVAGNFAQRVREAIDEGAARVSDGDRRRLIVQTVPRLVEALRRESDWKAVPGCFVGDARIVGSFAGTPVRQVDRISVGHGIGAQIIYQNACGADVAAGDQTPPESEHAGEAERGA